MDSDFIKAPRWDAPVCILRDLITNYPSKADFFCTYYQPDCDPNTCYPNTGTEVI